MRLVGLVMKLGQRGCSESELRVLRWVWGCADTWGRTAEVASAQGVWLELLNNQNELCMKLTTQVRSIGKVCTAIARGDLEQTIDIVAEGEIAVLKDTVNNMVKRLRVFSSEVSRVAHEVGTQGKLGGTAEVQGVEGT